VVVLAQMKFGAMAVQISFMAKLALMIFGYLVRMPLMIYLMAVQIMMKFK